MSFVRFLLVLLIITLIKYETKAQIIVENPGKDSLMHDSLLIPVQKPDTVLRITNFTPYFNMHIDSVLSYKFDINKNEKNYHWYLISNIAGSSINKSNGTVTIKPSKSYFLSGRLKYDTEYNVKFTVQNQNNATERIDTSFNITFYNTEIILPQIKPTISQTMIEEGETISFKIQCSEGTFPIESVIFSSNYPILNYKEAKNCGDAFTWTPDFDFVKETDSLKQKVVLLTFVGITKDKSRDTAIVRVIVKNGLNYPYAVDEYNATVKNIEEELLRLKYTFLKLDKEVRKTKKTRTVFDISSAGAATSGTILSSLPSDNNTPRTAAKNTGKILPSVGLAMVPVKEAISPLKNVEQNQAALLRSSIKRMEYMLFDNQLVGYRDPNILTKTTKLKDELRQSRVQLLDVPTEIGSNISKEELNRYFNNPKVNKNYRLGGKK